MAGSRLTLGLGLRSSLQSWIHGECVLSSILSTPHTSDLCKKKKREGHKYLKYIIIFQQYTRPSSTRPEVLGLKLESKANYKCNYHLFFAYKLAHLQKQMGQREKAGVLE